MVEADLRSMGVTNNTVLTKNRKELKRIVWDWFKKRPLGIELGVSNGISEDANLDTPELIHKYNYPIETHIVTTQDDYILTIHRIPNPGKQTILLLHGLLDSSAAFVLMGPNISLAYLLYDKNFDVWLGNSRGNKYSRKHKKLKSNDSKFWNFSWHEIGIYDLPAIIEYIENITQIQKLYIVGHSQGATAFFVMCAMRPEMNEKILLMNAFAPITFIHHIRTPFIQNIKNYLKSSKSNSVNEIMPRGWLMEKSKCFQRFIYKKICMEFIFTLIGKDVEQFNETMLPVIFNHIPAGGSIKQLQHYFQNYEQKKFQCYDYGTKLNQIYYGQSQPLIYNLSNIKAPVILYYGINDYIAAEEDVRLLYKNLGENLLGLYLANSNTNNFNHMDFIWAIDVLLTFPPPLTWNLNSVNKIPDFWRSSVPDFWKSFELDKLINDNNSDSDEDEDDIESMSNDKDILEDAKLVTNELLTKYNYTNEIHKIITEDGYILEMHRIPSKNKIPGKTILLMHGILDTSATWIIMGPKYGFAYMLSDLGYDVWMGNVRGNRYSKNHTTKNVNDKEYWDFSFHEIAIYDLPAMIDYILKNTGEKKIHYVGHSQGTTIFWVLCSEKPEYSKKIKSMHALAPVAFISEIRSPFIRTLVMFFDFFKSATQFLSIDEFLPNTKFLVKSSQTICHEKAITNSVCSNILFLIAGFNSEQLNKTMLPVMLSHTPSGASTKQLMHFGQLIRTGSFRKYDFDFMANSQRYGQFMPPDYNLDMVQVPVALYYSSNDWLVSLCGVEKLANSLPKVIDKYLVPMPEFNHLDFVWAVDGKKLLYNRIILNLNKFQ
ncbi:uncharacterized protein LOC129608376 [Condylostylus longicornis]|uniref:uncharacterized protein LOC129608376 n=1 Tax=Condylostylus longicornis TaxID=2530218 RepID=UPI00244E4A60|nr:uncharacterized protein LOC129608376 [Condylostylus longicornis]